VNSRSFRLFWQYELDLTKATGSVEAAKDDFISKLQRVVQLTGFSDPVYAEAYVNVQGFDIFLDVLIVNQTNETLQNLTCEFATLGDLKLVERPTTHTLGPQSFQSIKATIKVSRDRITVSPSDTHSASLAAYRSRQRRLASSLETSSTMEHRSRTTVNALC